MYVNSKTQKAGSHSKRQGKAISDKVGKRRKLMNSIHKLDLMLQEEFTSFNNLANAMNRNNEQIDDLMRTVDHTSERLNDLRSQQQFDLVCSGETEQRIGEILQGRSDVLNELFGIQYEMENRLGQNSSFRGQDGEPEPE
jgi:archaellum component FlaC